MSFPKLDRIGCQICLENFPNIGQFKSHIRGNEHHKFCTLQTVPKLAAESRQLIEANAIHRSLKTARLGENKVVAGSLGKCNYLGYICNINVMEHLAKHQRLIIGLSMMTVCHQAELRLLFYLCHLCEESCTQKQIMGHLYSPAHLINYFTYTDPDVLSFSWLPGPGMFQDLKPVAMEDVKKNGSGVLQVLDLPKDLFNVIRGLTYASAMSTLEENEKLASQLKESKPKRISVQSYVAVPHRKHALLGLQHLVECVCDGESGKRFHLCTLCQITLRGHAIIRHVISFDHVYRYINTWHPSTLRSKQYYTEYNALFKNSMLHYARQAEERSGTNNSIKQLTVTTEVFNLLEASYSKALDTLETISRECNGRSLITSIQPGDPLAVEDEDQKEHPTKPSLKLRCQNCKTDDLMSNYTKHLNHWTHASEQRSIFGSAVEDEDHIARIPFLKLFCLMKHPSEEPIIGLPFIVVCICSKVKIPAGYLCFACSEYFSEAEVLKHMSSQRHALFTVLQQRVPFAWHDDMDTMVLRQLALEEQQANGDRILKVFDIPYSIFSTLKFTFYNLTRGEELWNVQKHLRNDVPWLTNPKPELPLLGQDFVVKYSMMHGQNSEEWRFLCLLCGRNLGRKESTAHVLSYEHAKNFLEKAHCGSLDCSDVSREILLDLAEQAAERHQVSEMQTILLDEPLLDSKEYLKAVEILQRVKWRQSNCELIPVLAPGKRLVPNEVLQEIGHGHAKEEPQAESEKWTTKGGQSAVNKLHSTGYTPPRRIPPKTEPNIPAETNGGPTGGATNEMKVTKERVSTETPETSSKGPVKSQPETRMEVDSHPGKKIKEEPKTRDEVETGPSVVASGQPGTPVNVKQEPENEREEARVQVWTESSTQMCTAESMEETAMPRKRKACGSSEESGSKRLRLCLEDVSKTTANPSGHLTGVDDRNATEKALLDDVKPARAQLDKVPNEVLQEIGHGHAKEEPQAESEKWTNKGGQSAVNKLHSTGYTPPRRIPPKTEPNIPAETNGGPTGGATNEMKVTKERVSTETPETSSKGPVKSQPETRMEVDSHPGKKIKEEPKTRDEVETGPSVVASGQPGTPVNVKQEPENEREEARVQVWTESSTQMCTAESMEETAMPRKRKARGSSEESGSKRLRLCLEDVSKTTANPSGHLTGVDDRNATEKALLDDVKPARAQLDKVLASPPAFPYKLWDFIKMTDREPVIGLDALFECHCEPYAPIYLCKSCCVKVHEKDILGHITGMRHRMRYLKLQSIKVKRQQLAVRIAAAEQERRAGLGDAQAVELTPEQYSEMSKQSYDFALLLCQNIMQRSPPTPEVHRILASSKIHEQTGDKGQKNHDPQPLPEPKQPFLSVALMPTSNVVSLASDTGKTTHVPANPKVQQPGVLENKATSSPTLNSGATVKVSRTDANSQITVTSKSIVPEIGIPAKTPVEEFIPAPFFKPVATLLSISPSQSSVAVVKTPATSSKSIPSTLNMLTISSKGINASKLVNPLRAVTPSKDAAPAMDQEQTNPDASITCKSTPIPHSGIFSHPQPAVEALPPTRLLLSNPPGEQSTASTEQGLGSASPTTPVYNPSTFPPNHTAVADSSKAKSLIKNQPVVGTDSLVVVKCEKRRQSYCLLCSVRLRKGNHMTSNSHRYNYLKFHSFAWEMDEKRMLLAVTHLAELEKVQGTVVKTLEVNGESYNRLATFSEEKAVAKVKELLESQSHSSTKAKAEGLKCVSGSHAASRSADVEESDEVPHPMATGSPTQALPPLPRALEEPKMHITQPDPAPRREPSPQGPVGRPTAELDHRPSANSKHNGESIPKMEQKGEKILGPSDLSTFLMVHYNKEPIIGLALVFECRALFEETFYLCGSCMKTFPIKLICKHIVSAQHQHTYMLREYPHFMSWWDKDISPEEKEGLLKDISWKISDTEVYDQMDAQVIMLRKDSYDYIRQAPFIEALDTLQNISREKRPNRLFGYQKQLGPQTPETPSTRESMESNAREKDGPHFPIYSVPQDIVNGGQTLPVIGICAIVECSCEGQTPFYLCVACGNRLSQDLVLPHVKGQRHIQEYLAGAGLGVGHRAVTRGDIPGVSRWTPLLWSRSARYPRADELGVEPAQLLQPARGLEEQNLDEPSTMQRIILPQEDFFRIRTMTFDQALSSLKTMCENQRPSEIPTRVTSRP